MLREPVREPVYIEHDCVYTSPEGDNYAPHSVNPEDTPVIYVGFTPINRLHFCIMNQLRKSNQRWTDLNKATQITYIGELVPNPCSDDEYDESREYPSIQIEFGEHPVRNLEKRHYLSDLVLYEFSTNVYDESVYDGGVLQSNHRWWCGILFTGDNFQPLGFYCRDLHYLSFA